MLRLCLPRQICLARDTSASSQWTLGSNSLKCSCKLLAHRSEPGPASPGIIRRMDESQVLCYHGDSCVGQEVWPWRPSNWRSIARQFLSAKNLSAKNVRSRLSGSDWWSPSFGMGSWLTRPSHWLDASFRSSSVGSVSFDTLGDRDCVGMLDDQRAARDRYARVFSPIDRDGDCGLTILCDVGAAGRDVVHPR